MKRGHAAVDLTGDSSTDEEDGDMLNDAKSETAERNDQKRREEPPARTSKGGASGRAAGGAGGTSIFSLVDLVGDDEDDDDDGPSVPPPPAKRHTGAAGITGASSDVAPPRMVSATSTSITPVFRLLYTPQLGSKPGNGAPVTVDLPTLVKPGAQYAFLCNYMWDMGWVISECPELCRIPDAVLVHGERGERGPVLVSACKALGLAWNVTTPRNLEPYGTHHSKAMILFYEDHARVVIHTANMLECDWLRKTQGCWFQDFPRKADGVPASRFEKDLVDYLAVLHAGGCNMGETLRRIALHDFAAAQVLLVGSVPGRHQSASMNKFGHPRLAYLLKTTDAATSVSAAAPVVAQYSSQGSVDETWLTTEFIPSLAAGSKNTAAGGSAFAAMTSGRPVLPKLQLVWPTTEDVRNSIEGWAAGGSIPCHLANLNPPITSRHHHWDAKACGRARSMPHIKTFLRYEAGGEGEPTKLAWVLLTSHNLSKAAWGSLQIKDKAGRPTQCFIRSYELGVLFVPSMYNNAPFINMFDPHASAAVAKHVTADRIALREAAAGAALARLGQPVDAPPAAAPAAAAPVFFAIPHALPPTPYGPADVPWAVDRRYTEPDVLGNKFFD